MFSPARHIPWNHQEKIPGFFFVYIFSQSSQYAAFCREYLGVTRREHKEPIMITATRPTSVNRGWLRRQAVAGKLWLQCCYHYTDDYAFDNADGFGKMDYFKQAYLRAEFSHPLEAEIDAMYAAGASHADVEPKMAELSRLRQSHASRESEKAEGKIMLWSHDFRFKSGHASGDKFHGRFSIHSNLCYEYEVRG